MFTECQCTFHKNCTPLILPKICRRGFLVSGDELYSTFVKKCPHVLILKCIIGRGKVSRNHHLSILEVKVCFQGMGNSFLLKVNFSEKPLAECKAFNSHNLRLKKCVHFVYSCFGILAGGTRCTKTQLS